MDPVQDMATNSPDKLCLVDLQEGSSAPRSLSWSEFFSLRAKVASSLIHELHLNPGDTVAIYGKNSMEWVLLRAALHTVITNPDR